MDFSILQTTPQAQKTDCLVVGLFSDGSLGGVETPVIDANIQASVTELFTKKDHRGRIGDTAVLYKVAGVNAERVLIVGLGEKDKFKEGNFQKAIESATAALKQMNVTSAVSTLANISVKDYPIEWHLRHAVEVAESVVFKVVRFKTDDASKEPVVLNKVEWYLSENKDLAAAQKGLQQGVAIAQGVSTAREVADLPANYCTPTYLAERAKAIAAEYGFEIEVFDRPEIEAMGMGALLSVTKGSDEAPKFIVLRHGNTSPENKPVVLVGKGITFDSGGISLKPSHDMDEMKYDMCGAASVLGAFTAVGKLGLKVDLVGLIPTCENMPSGHATRPGDIVTSMLGKTIEVLNTDAEGRLILCDALAYARRFEPSAIIDMATLTGACVIALGYHTTGLMSNNDPLAEELIAAGRESFDRVWMLPIWPEYQEQIKGRFADIANSGSRDAGTITAGCFLSQFTEGFPWAHLDIAGTAYKSGKQKCATGRPVPLLVTYLLDKAAERQKNS